MVNPVVLRLVEEEYIPSSLNVILLDWYSIYWLSWYKSTKTDAAAAAGITRRKRPLESPPSTSSRVLVYEAFSY